MFAASAQCASTFCQPLIDCSSRKSATCATPAWPGAVMRAASASPRWFSMPDSSAISPASGAAARTHQRRRDPSLIQDDAAIGGDLGDARQADAQIAGALLGLEQVAQAQPADLQLRRLRRGGMRVVGLERTRGVAALGGVVGDFDRAGLADRQRQIHQHVARAVRHVRAAADDRSRRAARTACRPRTRRRRTPARSGRCRAGRDPARIRPAPRDAAAAPARGRAPAAPSSDPAAGSAACAGTCLPARPRGSSSSSIGFPL